VSVPATSEHPSVAIETDLVAVVPPPARGYEIRRRIADIIISMLCLLAVLPLCALVAAAIVITSPGSVLFRQRRIGRNGRPFMVYKFRTMYQDAERRRAALAEQNEASGPLFKMRRDPRITKVGKVLRRCSLDELPQLLNVIRGDMALVGPRPALPDEVAQYNHQQRLRLIATPGITGLWQVSGRSDLSFERAVQLDLEYVCCRSTWLDAKILLRTVPAVVSGRGAY